MSEQIKTTAGVDKPAPSVSDPGRNPQQAARALSPRDVATVVMARMNMVNTKKDELTIAIKGLSDTTQQLARLCAEQMQTIEALSQRLKAHEAAGAARGATNGDGAIVPPAVQGQRLE
ncbi:hypothetical protein [Variovorax saccharolyticus]|uniref:hypothetical protein n=1 Tax=Variovorax saccharolyticus TaxID=3053516 RepID=UPI002575FD98|nr:hypothetical protein [Variovorax sp. J22R187]MDM0019123.1 hypothetical protein [Variovorax sp. J22R187]